MDYENETHESAAKSSAKRIIIPVVIAAIVVLAVVGVLLAKKKDTNANAAVTPPPQTTASDSSATSPSDQSSAAKDSNSTGTSTGSQSSSSTSMYKDGVYNAEGSYTTPAGTEKVAVSLTVKDGVVTASDVTSLAVANDSKNYQGRFISGYKGEVVGKKLDSIKLDRVSGSSLTPNGFNNALEKIKTQAKA